MSVAGGVSKAVERAVVHGCEALQIFSKNANQWRGKPLDPAEIRRFRRAHRRDRHHAGRLARQLPDQPGDDVPAAARAVDRRVRRRARSRRRARAARRRHSSGHVHRGHRRRRAAADRRGDPRGVQGAAAAQDDGAARAHGRARDARSAIASSTSPRSSSISTARRASASASTPAISSRPATTSSATRATRETFAAFDRLVGLDRLRVFHGNDSKKPCGSRVDRHEHIGEGLPRRSSRSAGCSTTRGSPGCRC